MGQRGSVSDECLHAARRTVTTEQHDRSAECKSKGCPKRIRTQKGADLYHFSEEKATFSIEAFREMQC